MKDIWKRNVYLTTINEIVNYLFNVFNDKRWVLIQCIEELLETDKSINDITDKQDTWINHFIEKRHKDLYYMRVLFSAITDLSDVRRKSALLKFISLNDSFDDFEKLPLEPSSWSYSGSGIPYMQARIDYLSSLATALPGVKYINHRQKLEQDIAVWKELRMKKFESCLNIGDKVLT